MLKLWRIYFKKRKLYRRNVWDTRNKGKPNNDNYVTKFKETLTVQNDNINNYYQDMRKYEP